VYVVNELDSTVTGYDFNPNTGFIAPLEVVQTLPPDVHYRSTGAEIAVHPSGNYLYASNRGHDSIVIFGIEPNSGLLVTVGWEPTQGGQPRHFALDPSGTFLYAANQASDTITTFRIDPTSGMLKSTGQVVQTGSPVSIVFAGD
jgi:6-phosphogluconolactonase (cycloisomerase 2 family)